jgi:hypothetical protein
VPARPVYQPKAGMAGGPSVAKNNCHRDTETQIFQIGGFIMFRQGFEFGNTILPYYLRLHYHGLTIPFCPVYPLLSFAEELNVFFSLIN